MGWPARVDVGPQGQLPASVARLVVGAALVTLEGGEPVVDTAQALLGRASLAAFGRSGVLRQRRRAERPWSVPDWRDGPPAPCQPQTPRGTNGEHAAARVHAAADAEQQHDGQRRDGDEAAAAAGRDAAG